MSLIRSLVFTLLILSSVLHGPVSGQTPDTEDPQESCWSMNDFSYGLPMTVTNFTMPGFLILSAVPHSTWPAGKGRFISMMQFSSVNYFQVSQEVEDYLQATRGEYPRSLDEDDVDYIINLPEGKGFYIDGELLFANAFFVYGLTDSVDLAMRLSFVDYSGGSLDDVIFGFHDAFGLGQQGRPYVSDNKFQYAIGGDGQLFTSSLGRAPKGGMLDPQLFLRYGLRMPESPWSASLALGVKPPLHTSSTNLIGTDRWDFGVLIGLERRWTRDVFVLNAALVYPGKIVAEDSGDASFNRPLMPSINLSWIHRLKHWKNAEVFAQAMYAEHPLRDLFDSEFTDLDFQLTGGLKWHTRYGVFAFGMTENLFNMDNTPDIGFHVGWEWAID